MFMHVPGNICLFCWRHLSVYFSIANIVKDAGGEVPEYMMQIKKLPRYICICSSVFYFLRICFSIFFSSTRHLYISYHLFTIVGVYNIATVAVFCGSVGNSDPCLFLTLNIEMGSVYCHRNCRTKRLL